MWPSSGSRRGSWITWIRFRLVLACNYFLEHDSEASIDTLTVLRYKYHILLTQGHIAEAEEIVREVLEELPDSLRSDKLFVGFLSEEDKEEFPILKEGERQLPRLARDEQQQIIVTAQFTHILRSHYETDYKAH